MSWGIIKMNLVKITGDGVSSQCEYQLLIRKISYFIF